MIWYLKGNMRFVCMPTITIICYHLTFWVWIWNRKCVWIFNVRSPVNLGIKMLILICACIYACQYQLAMVKPTLVASINVLRFRQKGNLEWFEVHPAVECTYLWTIWIAFPRENQWRFSEPFILRRAKCRIGHPFTL